MSASETDGVAFASEREMVAVVLSLMSSGGTPWITRGTATEFDYTSGRTDVIALLGDDDLVLALEAKLTKWRKALQQAYRNTCFAHCSLVLLPPAAARRAVVHRVEFERRKIGLGVVDRHGIQVLIAPAAVDPLLPQLTTQARALLRSGESQ
jgi:hypothetical protein